MALDRDAFDHWFPVYLRYLGSVLLVVLIVANILGVGGIELAPAYTAATGMILYKSVHDIGRPKPPDETIHEAALRAARRKR